MDQHKMSTIDQIKKFVFAGNAIFTMANRVNGNRVTFKVTTPKGEKRDSIFFVNVLNGPDNADDYMYVGIVDGKKSRFNLTKKSRVGADSLSFKGFSWLMDKMLRGGHIPEAMEVLHSGRCGRCGRLLTTPESIKAGFGPECIGKIF